MEESGESEKPMEGTTPEETTPPTEESNLEPGSGNAAVSVVSGADPPHDPEQQQDQEMVDSDVPRADPPTGPEQSNPVTLSMPILTLSDDLHLSEEDEDLNSLRSDSSKPGASKSPDAQLGKEKERKVRRIDLLGEVMTDIFGDVTDMQTDVTEAGKVQAEEFSPIMSEALQRSHILEATKDPKLHRYLEADDRDLEDKPLDNKKRMFGVVNWGSAAGHTAKVATKVPSIIQVDSCSVTDGLSDIQADHETFQSGSLSWFDPRFWDHQDRQKCSGRRVATSITGICARTFKYAELVSRVVFC